MSFIKSYFRSIKLIYQAAPNLFIPLALLLTLTGFVPIIQNNSLASFIDGVGNFKNIGEATLVFLPFIFAMAVDIVTGPVNMLLQEDLSDKLIKKAIV